jgi:hypothetical protein
VTLEKYSIVSAANSIGRYVRKLAAIAHHGARCYTCGRRFYPINRDESTWQFAHIEPVRNHNDKSDRWGGRWCDERLFTDEWFAYMTRVRLTCSQRCNRLAEGSDDSAHHHDRNIELKDDLSMSDMEQLMMDL